MDWQEKYLDKLDRDISEMKNKLDRNISDMQSSLMTTEDRISSMISQTLGEMRDRDSQRHTEMLSLRSEMRDRDNQSQSDMKDIRNFMIEERRWIIAMAVATILGIATMVITVLIS